MGWKKFRQLIHSWFTLCLFYSFVSGFLEIFVLRKTQWHRGMKRRGSSLIMLDKVTLGLSCHLLVSSCFVTSAKYCPGSECVSRHEWARKYGFFCFIPAQTCCILELRIKGDSKSLCHPLTPQHYQKGPCGNIKDFRNQNIGSLKKISYISSFSWFKRTVSNSPNSKKSIYNKWNFIKLRSCTQQKKQ